MNSLVKVNIEEFNKFCSEFEEEVERQQVVFRKADKLYREDFLENRTFWDKLCRVRSPYEADNCSSLTFTTTTPKIKQLEGADYLNEGQVNLIFKEGNWWISHNDYYMHHLKGLKSLNSNSPEALYLDKEAFGVYNRLRGLIEK